LSFLVDSLDKVRGGTAGNIAYSAKLLGVNPLIFCPAGNDFFEYKKFFRTQKISTKYIPVYKDVPMSSYFVVTDKHQNQIGSFFIGALKYAKDHSISRVKEKISLAIIAPTDPRAMIRAVEECQKFNIPYIFDPAFQIATFTKEELEFGISKASILIGNDYEIKLIEDKLEISHEDLIVKTPILIQTLGSKGSIIETSRSSIHIQPVAVKKTQDPTGAGDSYRSGFIAGFVRNFPLDVCGQMGSVAASYVVEQNGTQKHEFTKNQFIKRFTQNYTTTITL
jgi:adenosine kinase